MSKPTTTDSVLHYSSNRPIHYKHAAFENMILVLLNISMNHNDYYEELNYIK